jgi:predicted nucleic acid-binding protein
MSEDIRKRSSFNSDEKIFLDTNVWYYIYGPKPKKPDEIIFRNIYSNALEKMLEGGCQIFIDALVISEFVNRYARDFYDRKYSGFSSKPKFKDFRKSQEFKSNAKLIADQTKKIIKDSHPCDLDFKSMNLHSHLIDYEKCVLDFNDILFGDLCKNKAYILVTNDGDFKGHCASILTANNNLL